MERTFTINDLAMGQDDLVTPPAGVPIEYDGDGTALPPSANYTQVKYECRVSISYLSILVE